MEKISFMGIRYCLSCRKETDHELIYLDKYLKAGRCLSCNETFDNRGNLIRIYYHDLLLESILFKPAMLYREVENSTQSQRKITFFLKVIARFFKELKNEISNFRQMYLRHKF